MREWVADNCPYQYYFKHVDYRFDDGVLDASRPRSDVSISSRFLQAVLGSFRKSQRIENQVEVVSSVGLSSDRGRMIGCKPH